MTAWSRTPRPRGGGPATPGGSGGAQRGDTIAYQVERGPGAGRGRAREREGGADELVQEVRKLVKVSPATSRGCGSCRRPAAARRGPGCRRAGSGRRPPGLLRRGPRATSSTRSTRENERTGGVAEDPVEEGRSARARTRLASRGCEPSWSRSTTATCGRGRTSRTTAPGRARSRRGRRQAKRDLLIALVDLATGSIAPWCTSASRRTRWRPGFRDAAPAGQRAGTEGEVVRERRPPFDRRATSHGHRSDGGGARDRGRRGGSRLPVERRAPPPRPVRVAE